RRPGAVVVDRDALEQRGVGAPRPHVRELLAEGRDGLFHVLPGALQNLGVGRHVRPPCTSVPMRAPVTAFLMFPGCTMLKTTSGNPLSMQREIAAAAITWSSLERRPAEGISS